MPGQEQFLTFRSTTSTILNENGFPPDVERQLAHAEHNEVRGAYNHAQHLLERRKVMQWRGEEKLDSPFIYRWVTSVSSDLMLLVR
jgi:hypothetical protein